MAKRKRADPAAATLEASINHSTILPDHEKRQSNRKSRNTATSVNPNTSAHVLDGSEALRASPTGVGKATKQRSDEFSNEDSLSDSSLSDLPAEPLTKNSKRESKGKNAKSVEAIELPQASVSNTKGGRAKTTKQAFGVPQMTMTDTITTSNAKSHEKNSPGGKEATNDPEADEDDEAADPQQIQEASRRPPPVNSDHLPLPWKGRLGYACLNTYLRCCNPPCFASRTTRIASILEHRHPLKDPTQPEHPTKNRPDKEQPPDIRRGQEFVERLGVANAKDMAKMIRWNDKYGIKFMRLSSEAFPFASHAEYGYKLAPFAADALAEVGEIAARLGHRLTVHPGQFTQLGSPRENVIDASIRDLEYHDEMLSLLKLPDQQDRDAVMILHMGGAFGDKGATLDRFRKNYARLSPSIKRRLVLENDDVVWSVHDLLPICQELNIPFVLDFHHHNIVFDETKIREGTHDIISLFPAILETWHRKGITPKMHYSEPTPPAVTPRQRRKHNPRVTTLPPCPNNMDLMIEAKDKEQAVFELMRNFKLPGYERLAEIVPYVREDENPTVRATRKKANAGDTISEDTSSAIVQDEDVGMGGPQGRVYWPPGMEEWLRPMKRVVKKKEPDQGGSKLSPAQRKEFIAVAKAELAAEIKAKRDGENGDDTSTGGKALSQSKANPNGRKGKASTHPVAVSKATTGRRQAVKRESPSSSSKSREIQDLDMSGRNQPNNSRRKARNDSRTARAARKSYKEEDDDDVDDDDTE